MKCVREFQDWYNAQQKSRRQTADRMVFVYAISREIVKTVGQESTQSIWDTSVRDSIADHVDRQVKHSQEMAVQAVRDHLVEGYEGYEADNELEELINGAIDQRLEINPTLHITNICSDSEFELLVDRVRVLHSLLRRLNSSLWTFRGD